MHKALALVAALAIMSLSAAADAAVTLNSVRIVAKNAESLGKFYGAAFGLKETNRLQTQGGPELFLNFGDTVEAARANSAAAVVVMQTPAGPAGRASVAGARIRKAAKPRL